MGVAFKFKLYLTLLSLPTLGMIHKALQYIAGVGSVACVGWGEALSFVSGKSERKILAPLQGLGREGLAIQI
jgi:hypothetical protein